MGKVDEREVALSASKMRARESGWSVARRLEPRACTFKSSFSRSGKRFNFAFKVHAKPSKKSARGEKKKSARGEKNKTNK